MHLWKMIHKFIRICVIRDFEDIIDAIRALDADVISIETSRSHGELIHTFKENTYEKEIGLGVYDIHSPRVPSKEEIKQNINRALQMIPPINFGSTRTVD